MRGGWRKTMGLMETGAWRVCWRWEHVCRAEKIEWCCKRTAEVQVISEDLIWVERIPGQSEKIHFCNTFDDNNRSVSFGFVEKGNPVFNLLDWAGLQARVWSSNHVTGNTTGIWVTPRLWLLTICKRRNIHDHTYKSHNNRLIIHRLYGERNMLSQNMASWWLPPQYNGISRKHLYLVQRLNK